YRLLVARLYEEESGARSHESGNGAALPDSCRLSPDSWLYPIHLGVTEAGEGEDARIKSAIGIGSLLDDGIGDTIRVSLTEDSIHEIPVAKAMVAPFNHRGAGDEPAFPDVTLSYDPFSYHRRETARVEVGGFAFGGE